VKEKVNGKTIIVTTTNGTIAIKTAMKFEHGIISSFLNLSATARYIIQSKSKKLTIICSGTRDQAALEDIIAAGALISKLNDICPNFSDSAMVARDFYLFNKNNLSDTVRYSANAKRLLSNPELCDDVGFCLQLDLFNFVGVIMNGKILKG
jgi:2-phosphosulfolactate phosphatase